MRGGRREKLIECVLIEHTERTELLYRCKGLKTRRNRKDKRERGKARRKIKREMKEEMG